MKYTIKSLLLVDKFKVDVFLLLKILSCSSLSMKIASVVPLPDMKPKYMLLIDLFPDNRIEDMFQNFHHMFLQFKTSVVSTR